VVVVVQWSLARAAEGGEWAVRGVQERLEEGAGGSRQRCG